MPRFIPVSLRLEIKNGEPFVDITENSEESAVSRHSSGSQPMSSRKRLPRATGNNPPPAETPQATQRQCFGKRTFSEIVVETFAKDASEEPSTSSGPSRSVSLSRTTNVQPSASKSSVVSKSPDRLKFFSGNPLVEKTTGVLHFYKNKSAIEIMSENCWTLCMMAVPAYVTCSELLRFISPAADKIIESKIIRDSSPNQYFVVIKFKSAAGAFSFYQEYNGVEFNSLENDNCALLFVERMETTTEDNGGSLPIEGLVELPTCAVCLERMDDGVLTILCNHSFHAECLQHWEDTTCPVCRFHQTPEMIPDQKCSECGKTNDLWMCLICGNIGCGRYAEAHARKHFELTSHTFVKSLEENLVWDYAGDNFVHRLIQSSNDGKMVELQGSDELKSDEKESMKIEYSLWFSSQMEFQRQYFEDRLKEMEEKIQGVERSADFQVQELGQKLAIALDECSKLKSDLANVKNDKAQLEKKMQKAQQIIRKLQSDLEEEKQMSKLISADKETLTAKNVELEKLREVEIKNLQDQVNDLMMHFEAQTKLAQQVSDAKITTEELESCDVGVEETNLQKIKKNRKRNK